MSTKDMPLIHVRWQYRFENVSQGKGKRVLRDLERKGLVRPLVTPTKREYITPAEAEILHQALHA